MKFYPKRLLQYVVLGVLGIVYALVREYIPITTVCMFRSHFGIYCVGCGATRMIQSLLRLDLYQAFRYNAFILITLPFIIFMLLVLNGTIILKKKYHKIYYICLTVFSVGAVVFMILRNTVMTELAPIMI